MIRVIAPSDLVLGKPYSFAPAHLAPSNGKTPARTRCGMFVYPAWFLADVSWPICSVCKEAA